MSELDDDLASDDPLVRKRAKARQWKLEHSEHVRDLNRRWKEANADRSRQLNRESMRRTAAQRRRHTEVLREGQERSKRWRRQNTEHVRDYQKNWVEANREKVRTYANRYYQAHREEVSARAAARRDADPDHANDARKEWARQNRDRLAHYRRARRSKPEIYEAELNANAAARRLKRRLQAVGLPAKRLHPSTAAERRANERESDAYFGDPALAEHVRQFTVFAATLTEHMLENDAQMREFADAYAQTRARMGLPAADTERVIYARAVELITGRVRRVDLLTSHDVAAAVRSTKAAVWQTRRRQQCDGLLRALASHTELHLDRLSDEAAFENRARRVRGRPAVAVDALVVQLALHEVIPAIETTHLTVEDARRAGSAARLRIAIPAQGDGRIRNQLTTPLQR